MPEILYPYTPTYAVAPGETLAEYMAEVSTTVGEMSIATGLTEETIEALLYGKAPIDDDTADRLADATGIRAVFWLRLEADYRELAEKFPPS